MVVAEFQEMAWQPYPVDPVSMYLQSLTILYYYRPVLSFVYIVAVAP